MQIIFQDIDLKNTIITISKDIYIYELKSLIQDIWGMSQENLFLYFNNVFLEEGKLLSDYKIINNSIIINKLYSAHKFG